MTDTLISYDAAVVNSLMAQKDEVFSLINGDMGVFAAKKLLDSFHPLWNALGYGYKGRELYRIIRDEARRQLKDEIEYLAGCRKNDRTRGSTEATIAKLEALIKEC